jgi:hypothetical protein
VDLAADWTKDLLTRALAEHRQFLVRDDLLLQVPARPAARGDAAGCPAGAVPSVGERLRGMSAADGSMGQATVAADGGALVVPAWGGFPPEHGSASHLHGWHGVLRAPTRLAIDVSGNVYVADALNGRIAVRAPDGRIIEDLRGFDCPVSVAVDAAGRLHVIRLAGIAVQLHTGTAVQIHRDAQDSGGTGLQVFGPDGILRRLVTLPSDRCGFVDPCNEGPRSGRARDAGIHVTGEAIIYLTDSTKGRVKVMEIAESAPGEFMGVALGNVGDYGTAPGKLRVATDVVLDPCGRVLVTPAANGRVDLFRLTGHADPEAFAPARLQVITEPLDPVTDTMLRARLEIAGHRLAAVEDIVANGLAVPLEVSVGDSNRDTRPDLSLTFVADLVQALVGAAQPTLSVTGTVGPLALQASAPVTLLVTDADGDGVDDPHDSCPENEPGAVMDAHGCCLGQSCPCGPALAWASHGQYVACVAAATGRLIEVGVLSVGVHGSIMREAARSGCGKFSPASGRADERAKQGCSRAGAVTVLVADALSLSIAAAFATHHPPHGATSAVECLSCHVEPVLSNASSGLVRSGGTFTGRIEKTYGIVISSEGEVGIASFDWDDGEGNGGSGIATGADVALDAGLQLRFENGDTAPSFVTGDTYTLHVRTDLRLPVFSSQADFEHPMAQRLAHVTRNPDRSFDTTYAKVVCTVCHDPHKQAPPSMPRRLRTPPSTRAPPAGATCSASRTISIRCAWSATVRAT